MKKIAIALTTLAGITLLSGCAYDRGPYYDRYSFNEYAYVSPYHHYYFRDSRVAASLKLVPGASVTQVEFHFRDSRVAASLKP